MVRSQSIEITIWFAKHIDQSGRDLVLADLGDFYDVDYKMIDTREVQALVSAKRLANVKHFLQDRERSGELRFVVEKAS